MAGPPNVAARENFSVSRQLDGPAETTYLEESPISNYPASTRNNYVDARNADTTMPKSQYFEEEC